MALSARDRGAVVELLGQTQLVVALGTYPKARFAASRRDQEAVAARLQLMSETAAKLSTGFKRDRADVPWDDLAEAGRIARGGVDPDELGRLWRAVKKLAPKIARALREEVGEDPSTAFALAAETPPARPATAKASARTRRAAKKSR